MRQDVYEDYKGPRFTKVYDGGWKAIRSIAGNPRATQVYAFLCENAGHDNTLVCTLDVIAGELEVSERTIMRATSVLQKAGHISIAKVGTANAYILNPSEVWKTYEDNKRYCAFGARTLVSKAANKQLKRRLTHMMGQSDLFADEEV